MQDSQVIRRPNALMANLLGARRGLWRRPMWTPEHVKKIWFLLLQMTNDGYTMKGDSRGGKLIGTSPSDGSRMVVDVMSYRKPRVGRTADCRGHTTWLCQVRAMAKRRRRNSDASPRNFHSKFTHTNIVSILILIKSFFALTNLIKVGKRRRRRKLWI
jgi:hypothetical protein